MSMFLVVSRTHSLLPFSHRLRLEGHDAEVLVDVPAFERAWEGKLRKVARGSRDEINPDTLAPVIAAAEKGEVTVLIDAWKLETVFGNAQRKFGVCRGDWSEPKLPLRVGGWFTGEKLQALHGLIVDIGAWPGGGGEAIDGAMTMVRIDNPTTAETVEEILQPTLQTLKALSFRGLVQLGIQLDTASGVPEVEGVSAGWPWLQSHAFVSGLEGFGEVLLGQRDPEIPKKFTTVIPISRPPWPNRKARFRRPVQIEGLTDQQVGRIFLHDVRVDEQARQLWTAGLDGLVGVARGEADTSELSKGLALEVALRCSLPEKQFRADAGAHVQSALGRLEHLLGLTF